MIPPRAVTVAPIGSALLHAVAIVPAAELARSSCPILDACGGGPVIVAMAAVLTGAWALHWGLRLPWLRRWAAALARARLDRRDLSHLLDAALPAVAGHTAAFLLAAVLGGAWLERIHGPVLANPRWWYSVVMTAGFVATLDAALAEYLLARSLRGAAPGDRDYRSIAGRPQLRGIVAFALATLPVALIATWVVREVVLDQRLFDAKDLVGWLADASVVVLAWALVLAWLVRATERIAAGEVLRVIRELEAEAIPRAPLTVGGPWGETAAALNAAADRLEERSRLERAVRAYVGDDVADTARERDPTSARGERVRATISFSDIRGFTAWSASRPPEEVVALLDHYLEVAVAAVTRHGGQVDKFIGDGVMAVFAEQPGADDRGAAAAVAAACDLVDSLRRSDVSMGDGPILVGVGLNAGEVIRGNIGSTGRKQWTVIGDAVNLASRLESMTKELGEPIVFSATVAEHLPPDRARPLGSHAIRGQPHPTACYTVTAPSSPAAKDDPKRA